jgi:hypothetical protein
VLPYFVGAGAGNVAASGTTVIPVLPAGTLANDIACVVALYNSGANLTIDANYNNSLLGAQNNATGSTAAFWRRLTGGDANPTITSSVAASSTVGLYGRVYVFRDCVQSGTPFENAAGTSNTSTTPATTATVTTAQDRLVAALAMIDDDNTWSSGNPPAGWSGLGALYSTATGGDVLLDGIQIPALNPQTVGAVNIGTMSASDFWRVVTFALIPQVPYRRIGAVGAGT